MAMIKCPNCGKINDDSLDFCIYCGIKYDEFHAEREDDPNVFIFRMGKDGKAEQVDSSSFSKNPFSKGIGGSKHTVAIVIGYILAILGGFLGFIFAIYLLTRKDPSAKRHGLVQLIILLIEYAFIAYMFLSGQLDTSVFLNPFNMTNLSNMSQMNMSNMSQINVNGSTNISSLFGL